MTLPRIIVLDANIVARLALCSEGQWAAASARLRVAAGKGGRFVLCPTVLTEICATYRNDGKLARLLGTAAEVCGGLLPLDAFALLRTEAEAADPYTLVTGSPLLQIPTKEDVGKAVANEDVAAFYAEGMFGYDKLRSSLEAIDKLPAADKKTLTFSAYFAQRLTLLGDLLEMAAQKGRIPTQPYDAQALWDRAASWRFLTSMLLATVFRRARGIHLKAEGCMTDLRLVIESGYAHEIWTADKELAECGILAREYAKCPRLLYWDPRG